MDYLNDIVFHVKSLKLPTYKDECILVHKTMLLKSSECIAEAMKMAVEGNILNDEYDNRIKDAIMYLILAKESL